MAKYFYFIARVGIHPFISTLSIIQQNIELRYMTLMMIFLLTVTFATLHYSKNLWYANGQIQKCPLVKYIVHSICAVKQLCL